ncbi:MAG: MATE family efflux transporter [Synergistaceae bacterium]|nr:MATE family efflux transporter [Synergistaceae bacterium]
MSERTREILKIGVPAIFEELATTLAGIIDSQMVSSMGLAAISAISVTNQPRLFIMCLFFAVNIVMSVLTAHKLGADDRDGANSVLFSGLIITLIAGLFMSMICVIFARPIMLLCSGQPDTLNDSVLYFKIVMGGLIFNLLYLTINAALRGCGHTRITMTSNLTSCGVNIIFNYLLINGNLGFPALKIAGAALATVLGNVAALIVCVIFACQKKLYVNFPYIIASKVRLTRKILRDIYDKWLKAAGENILSRVGFLACSVIAARIGSYDMAIYSVGMHLMNINFALGSGFQTAAIALIGKSYGANNSREIKSYVRQISRIGLLFAFLMSAAMILTSKYYFALFSDDDKFIKAGVFVCVIIAVISPIQTWKIILNGCLRGLGDMTSPLKAAVISVTIFQPPANLILAILLGLGHWGIWIAMFLSQLIQMLLLARNLKKKIYLV